MVVGKPICVEKQENQDSEGLRKKKQQTWVIENNNLFYLLLKHLPEFFTGNTSLHDSYNSPWNFRRIWTLWQSCWDIRWLWQCLGLLREGWKTLNYVLLRTCDPLGRSCVTSSGFHPELFCIAPVVIEANGELGSFSERSVYSSALKMQQGCRL